jgi:hypothetical protein
MSFLENNIYNETQLSQRQRWALYLSYAIIIICLYIGFNLRENSLNRTTIYTNIEAGITALYPEHWLLDEAGDYVLRVRDMSNRGFKTVMQVSTLPVTNDTVERNLLDRLSLNRSQTFIDYSILGYNDYLLPDETPAIAMSYTFVSRDASPFLEGVSTVVVGLDILTIQRGQALILTFRADSITYEQEFSTFERFIQDIDF